MKNLFLFLFFLVISTPLFQGCKKDHLLGKFLLTEKMKSQNPFHGGETLYFISDSLKEFVVDCIFRRDQIHKYHPSISESGYYLIEVEQTSCSGNYNGFWLEMAGQINSTPEFKIQFSFEKKGGDFRFNLPLNKETSDYADSIRVRDKWYYDVFINEQDSDTAIRANKLYYSTQYGIIKIEWPDGHFMELEKIDWPQ